MRFWLLDQNNARNMQIRLQVYSYFLTFKQMQELRYFATCNAVWGERATTATPVGLTVILSESHFIIRPWSHEGESWEARVHEKKTHVLVKRGWELMRVEKREFAWEFSQLPCPGQTRMRVTESWEARVCIGVFSTIMSWSNEDESWEARVCMRVFSTLMSWSNEDESYWELRSESLYRSFLNYNVLVKRGWELLRVEKQEFVSEFSQLSCPGQTRMRVEKLEFVSEFSELSCLGQTRMRARVCMVVFPISNCWGSQFAN